jgi:hypothetical protein
VLSVARWLDRNTLSSSEKDGFGCLLDHVNCRPKICVSCRLRSLIRSLKGSIECRFGLEEEESRGSCMILKSSRTIHEISCRHANIFSLFRKDVLRSFCVGSYTLVSMKLNPLVLVSSTLMENGKAYMVVSV